MNPPRSDDDRYLWDRSGTPDPEIERLEGLLAPLAHRPDAQPPVAAPRRRWLPLAAAAAVLMAVGAGAAWLLSQRSDETTTPTPPEVATLEVLSGDDVLRPGSWVDAESAPRDVTVGSVARLTLDPGSRLRLDVAKEEEARLFLERGRLEARVSADAKPRFFQVDTRAARCVDLGCHYTLAVDPEGVARVDVTTGRVAFELAGREVFVPEGAGCVARPSSGPGTPRFEDAPPALVKALDDLDAAGSEGAERRRELAAVALATMASSRDTLSAYHLLSDSDPKIAIAARSRIVELAGEPEGTPDPVSADATPPSAAERELWKVYLYDGGLWR